MKKFLMVTPGFLSLALGFAPLSWGQESHSEQMNYGQMEETFDGAEVGPALKQLHLGRRWLCTKYSISSVDAGSEEISTKTAADGKPISFRMVMLDSPVPREQVEQDTILSIRLPNQKLGKGQPPSFLLSYVGLNFELQSENQLRLNGASSRVYPLLTFRLNQQNKHLMVRQQEFKINQEYDVDSKGKPIMRLKVGALDRTHFLDCSLE